MSNRTFTPGTRVKVFPYGETGTVADAPEISAHFTRFVPVIIDGRPTATPCSSDNLVVIEPAAAAPVKASAVGFIRKRPELTTPDTTYTDLFVAATDVGLPPSALFDA